MADGHQSPPTDVDNPFGANINDILRQSFFWSMVLWESFQNLVLYHYADTYFQTGMSIKIVRRCIKV